MGDVTMILRAKTQNLIQTRPLPVQKTQNTEQSPTNLDTTYFERCIATLERAFESLNKSNSLDIDYDVYRSASIKEFEIILEQSGKLLKKVLKPFFPIASAVDKLIFKDIFRHATLHGIISLDESERWLQYRDARNTTAHDYGIELAEDTLKIIPQFIEDAKRLNEALKKQGEENATP